MTDAVLIVDYDPFNIDSRVSLMQDGQKQDMYRAPSNVPELAERLVSIANELKVYSIRVRGPLAIMSEVKNKVAEQEMMQYSEHKIIVEGL